MKCLKGNELHEIVQRTESCIFDDNFDNIVDLVLKLDTKRVENHVQQQVGDRLEELLDNIQNYTQDITGSNYLAKQHVNVYYHFMTN